MSSPQAFASLAGAMVRLEPLLLDHAEGLVEAAQSDEIWRFTLDRPQTLDAMWDYVSRAIAAREDGSAMPFAVRYLPAGRLIGCTRYINIAPARRGLEIGFTWYAREFWGSGVNVESKYLLLKHAFEDMRSVRVEFQAMAGNARSRAAILRLGATEEGVLRSRLMRNDEPFDSVFFSILDREWPGVKSNLESRMRSAAR